MFGNIKILFRGFLIVFLFIYGLLGSCLTMGWLILFYFGTEKETYDYFTLLDKLRLSLPFIAIICAIVLLCYKGTKRIT